MDLIPVSEMVPTEVCRYLPFTAEAISEWNERTDLLRFLYLFYDRVGLPTYSQDIYERGREEFQVWAVQFGKVAQDAPVMPGAVTKSIIVPNFIEEPLFGKMAKHVIAWDCVCGAVLEEGAFYSLAHVLESEQDLKCSVLLASQLYYRQALQVLRNFIEALVLQLHFCDHPQEYAQWKADNYKVPPLRGKQGILKGLVTTQSLSTELAEETSDIYDNMNAYVHGSQSTLINKGVYTQQWMGAVFKNAEFCDWCEKLSAVVQLGIRLIRASLVQWERVIEPKWVSLLSQRRILCITCHNESDFDVDKDPQTATSGDFLHYICRQCGSPITVRIP